MLQPDNENKVFESAAFIGETHLNPVLWALIQGALRQPDLTSKITFKEYAQSIERCYPTEIAESHSVLQPLPPHLLGAAYFSLDSQNYVANISDGGILESSQHDMGLAGVVISPNGPVKLEAARFIYEEARGIRTQRQVVLKPGDPIIFYPLTITKREVNTLDSLRSIFITFIRASREQYLSPHDTLNPLLQAVRVYANQLAAFTTNLDMTKVGKVMENTWLSGAIMTNSYIKRLLGI